VVPQLAIRLVVTWITVIWSMVASACFTLALVHGFVWCARRRQVSAHGVFAIFAASTALFAVGELWLMRSRTTVEYGAVVRWLHVPACALIIALVVFVRLRLQAGRLWLAWLVAGVRLVALPLNFIFTPNLNYREITALRHLTVLGESVSIPVGVRNPWMLFAQSAFIFLVIFVLDALITVWRRGSNRRELFLTGAIALFVIAGSGQIVFSIWGLVDLPPMSSVFYSGIIVSMALDLGAGVIRSAKLSEELLESEERMSLAVEAAQFGIWIRDLTRDKIWASARWRELFGFKLTEPLEFEAVLERIHPDDREAVRAVLLQASEGDGRYEIDFRLILPDGKVRWIASRGRVDFAAGHEPVRVRGASLDVTARKLAEEAAHHLSGRLIDAQEKAHSELARDLHDDFSQSLALLSVELEIFGQHPPSKPEEITARMEKFSTGVKTLSAEVHRLSHDLHPAKLDQLGLVAAVKGFCKELAQVHELAIEFTERDVPRELPPDAALCLYRVAQEALQNVVKHSGATIAKVELIRNDGHLRLLVSDDGAGFDPRTARNNGSLGLVSMSERARFVGGRLAVESRADSGTRIEVRIPLSTAIKPTIR